MQIIRSLRRYLASILIAAGFSYPACAAVCPKGIGGCISPGKCFLFVDADGNSLCDYTTSAGPANSPDVHGTVVQETIIPPQNGSLPAIQTITPDDTAIPVPFFPFIAGIFSFLALTTIFFVLIQRGLAGLRIPQTMPALALATVPSLCISLAITGSLAGGIVSGTVLALIYCVTGTILTAYLWKAGVMTHNIALGLAAFGVLAGFVFVGPIMPLEAGLLIAALTGTPVSLFCLGAIGIILVLTFLFGRVFCGTICPVGSLQELVYTIPCKKIAIHRTRLTECIRLAVFITWVIAFLCFVDLMAFTGLYDFFSLALSGSFLVAAVLIALSAFIYRPICRVLCPFGLLFSLAAEFSLFRLQRSGSCTCCRRCESACPTGIAGREDSKRECYFCGRCTDACTKECAQVYRCLTK